MGEARGLPSPALRRHDVAADGGGVGQPVEEAHRARMQWMAPEAVQRLFIGELDRDEGMPVRGRVVHPVTHSLDAGNLHE